MYSLAKSSDGNWKFLQIVIRSYSRFSSQTIFNQLHMKKVPSKLKTFTQHSSIALQVQPLKMAKKTQVPANPQQLKTKQTTLANLVAHITAITHSNQAASTTPTVTTTQQQLTHSLVVHNSKQDETHNGICSATSRRQKNYAMLFIQHQQLRRRHRHQEHRVSECSTSQVGLATTDWLADWLKWQPYHDASAQALEKCGAHENVSQINRSHQKIIELWFASAWTEREWWCARCCVKLDRAETCKHSNLPFFQSRHHL